jgi:hypothetical protein
VTVCSPATVAVSSPVHFIAAVSTTCAKGVASVGIYSSPGKRVYLVNGSTLDTFVPLSKGTYDTTVQERDKCGGSSADHQR